MGHGTAARYPSRMPVPVDYERKVRHETAPLSRFDVIALAATLLVAGLALLVIALVLLIRFGVIRLD